MSRPYVTYTVNKTSFEIDSRYANLQPVSERNQLDLRAHAPLPFPFSHKFSIPLPSFSSRAQVGRGSYGIVMAADDLVTGHRVAIKRVARVFQDLVDAKRILREIKLLR